MSGSRRVLVTATNLDLDGTAEGSCTVKYLELLSRQGHEVLVVNGANRLHGAALPWLRGVDVVDLDGPVEQEPVRGPIGQKLGAARAHLSGFGDLERRRLARWRRTLPEVMTSFAPDLVVTRAGGLDVTPHLAMLDRAGEVPWVAHLHDPWPLSLFPEPYRRHEGLLSLRQEAALRRVLRRADAVTFPGDRHRAWQLRASRVDLGARAVVVPHLGLEGELVAGVTDPWGPEGSATTWAPPAPGPGPLRLIHCGSLFRQRDPAPLLDALAQVVGSSPPGEPPLHLTLLGWIDPKLRATDAWARRTGALVEAGALSVRPGNVSYPASIAALEASDVLLTYVVGTPESPQLPAKLADLLSLGRPMLVVAPRASGPTDLIGAGSPAFVDREDPSAITTALRQLVERRAAGSLGALRPTAEQRRAVSPETVGAAIDHAFAVAAAHHRDRGGRRAAPTAHRPERSVNTSGPGSAPSG